MGFDANIFAGLEVPDRAVTLDIETTLGTGHFTKGVDAYYIGTDISKLPAGVADLLFSARRDRADYSAGLGSYARKWEERHRRRLAGTDAGRGNN